MCAYVYKGEYVCMYAQMRKYCVSKNIIYFLCLKEKIGHTLEKKRKSEKISFTANRTEKKNWMRTYGDVHRKPD